MHMFFGKKTNSKIKDYIIENIKSKISVSEIKESKGFYPFFTSGSCNYMCNEFISNGNFIYLNTGGNAGVKFYSGKAGYSTDTWCISFKNELTSYFYVLLFSIKNELNKKYFQGTSLKHLQKDQFLKMDVYIPNELEIKTFNNLVNSDLEKISSKNRQNFQLIETRDKLLPLLINGQLSIDD